MDKSRIPRFFLAIAVIAAAVIVLAALWKAVIAFRPMPPRTVMMVTGPEGGAYYEFGKRYRELLARQGIDLQLSPTAGSPENLSHLRDPRSKAEAGFLQAGITNEKESPDLESLGTVSYEPLWFFCRSALSGKMSGLRMMEGLRGKRISIGPEGSGTRALALELLARNGIDQRFAELLPLTPQEAGEKLLGNEIDAAFMLTSWDSPVVRRLLADENIELMTFPRADAYVALYPYLDKVMVPEGVGNLAKNRPPANVILFAPKASLVVRKGLHPAIQYLLLDAAQQIHSGPGIFQKAGQFPAAESVGIPLSDIAANFYKSGRPFLHRHFPVWFAALIERLLIMLIPLVAMILPLIRFMPPLYTFGIRWRINRMYGELRFLEKELESRGAGQSIGDLSGRLDQLEAKASRFRAPRFCANLLYTLRVHIAVVRSRLNKAEGARNTD